MSMTSASAVSRTASSDQSSASRPALPGLTAKTAECIFTPAGMPSTGTRAAHGAEHVHRRPVAAREEQELTRAAASAAAAARVSAAVVAPRRPPITTGSMPAPRASSSPIGPAQERSSISPAAGAAPGAPSRRGRARRLGTASDRLPDESRVVGSLEARPCRRSRRPGSRPSPILAIAARPPSHRPAPDTAASRDRLASAAAIAASWCGCSSWPPTPSKHRQERVLDVRPDPGELFDHRQAAEGDVGGRVAALVARRPACRRNLVGRTSISVGQRAVAVASHHHPRQRVHHRGVEARGDDDQLRLEALAAPARRRARTPRRRRPCPSPAAAAR